MAEATLITLEEVNRHLNLNLIGAEESPPFGADDRTPNVELQMAAAEDIILDYLKRPAETGWTAETVPGQIKSALLLMTGALLGFTGDEQSGARVTPAELLAPAAGAFPGGAVYQLLVRSRDPALR